MAETEKLRRRHWNTHVFKEGSKQAIRISMTKQCPQSSNITMPPKPQSSARACQNALCWTSPKRSHVIGSEGNMKGCIPFLLLFILWSIIINSTFSFILYPYQFPLSLLLFLPCLPQPILHLFLFRKGQACHGCLQSMVYQVEVGISISKALLAVTPVVALENPFANLLVCGND